MSARALLPQWPDRQFMNCYYDIPGGPTVYAYLSRDPDKGDMLAVDLFDAKDGSPQQAAVSMMRAGTLPFHGAEIVTAGRSGRFIVAQILPVDGP